MDQKKSSSLNYRAAEEAAQLERVNIKQLPKNIAEAKGRLVILPDMHGNTLKFFFSLVKEGIFKVSSEYYAEIVGICERSETLNDQSAKDADRFHEILEHHVTVTAPHRLHLLGDLLADRGFCGRDDLNLEVLWKLGVSKVDYKISGSNHDLEFLALFRGGKTQSIPELMYAKSFYFLEELLIKYPGRFKQINELVDKHFVPHLEILSGAYFPSKKRFIHLSHAPTSTSENQPLLETYYGIEEDKSSLEKIIKNRIEINKRFLQEVQSPAWAEQWGPACQAFSLYRDSKLHPIIKPAWEQTKFPQDDQFIEDYSVLAIHGHIGGSEDSDNRGRSTAYRINLDYNNLLGKGKNLCENQPYRSLSYSDAQTLEEYLGAQTSVIEELPLPPEQKPNPPDEKAVSFPYSPAEKAFWRGVFDRNRLGESRQNARDIVAAARNAHWSRVSLLIDLGVEVNQKSTQNGRTALHYAAEQGNVTAVQFLIEQGADKTCRDKIGGTPLNELIESLLSLGPSETKQDQGQPAQTTSAKDSPTRSTVTEQQFANPSCFWFSDHTLQTLYKSLGVLKVTAYTESALAAAFLLTLVLAQSDPFTVWGEASWAKELLHTDTGLLALKDTLTVCALVAAPFVLVWLIEKTKNLIEKGGEIYSTHFGSSVT